MRTLIVLSLAALTLACADSTGPDDEIRPEAELNFLVFPDSITALLPREVSFWARKGVDREVSLSLPGPNGDDEFLEFEVPSNSLHRYPDGSLFETGDSVLITITIDPANRFLFTFEPAGLQFNPDDPAELEIEFDVLGGDLNGDGTIDAKDADLRSRLDMWKQAQPGSVWTRQHGRLYIDRDEIEADVTSFSGFCIAT
ncbi:MAG: hypothetical protein KFH98_06150 [Gemmatimonadetes bacterium]|nr:hypothetical protein [Gemmatimonadota bacterium]